MEVHRQQCQACKGRELRNILVRTSSEPHTVYVRCANCGELVARYRLREYYHHHKGVESYLRSAEHLHGESGRHFLDEFERIRRESLEGYAEALEELRRANKPI